MNIEAFFKITYGLYVVSSGYKEKLNGYVSNTVFQVTAEPPQLAISCSKNNFTEELIRKSKVFSISILQKEINPDIIGTFGYRSGKDLEKFGKFNYKTGLTGAPILLDNTLAWFECEVVQTIDVGSHVLFIGKVIDGDTTGLAGEPLTYAWYREVKKGVAPKNAPTYIDKSKLEAKPKDKTFKKFKCPACGFIYDESKEPVKFKDLPDDWICPACGTEKADFIEIE